MCGICGLVEPRSPDRDARLRAMREGLRHRGPDDAGEYGDEAAALGSTRLAVIDLEGGRQPMGSEDGSIRLVLNGEIYNFRELRGRLAAHAFRTRCDAEVVVHAYEEWGPDCLARLDGMFALAIWDARKRELFLARDRFGKKPLVYRHEGERLAFASELTALRAGVGPWAFDPDGLEPYVAYGYVPAPATMIRGVRKLPPGHWLRFAGGRLEVRRYWEPVIAIEDRPAAERIERVRGALARAVERRLVSDVPLGVFLSGGIDSSIVTGLMSRRSAGRVRTFTVAFREPGFNEAPFARAVAAHFGTEHHELTVTVDAAGALPSLVAGFGEPFADPSALPTWYLARETRRHVTVALSGDGGDESFAGYRRHQAMAGLQSLKSVAWLVRLFAPFYRSRRPEAPRIRRLLGRIHRPLAELYRDLVSVFGDDRRSALLGRNGSVAEHVERPFGAGPDPVTGAGYADLVTYLPGDLLAKVDAMSMAHGLEVRCPFLDPEVVAVGFSIPGRAKLAGGETKGFLRRAFRDLLPDPILRRPKAGFGLPLDGWLRGPLRATARDLLLDRTARERGLFAPDEVERLLAEHDGGASHGARLWLLLVFELWARTLVEP